VLEPGAFAIAREAPRQGEQSREILREAGYADEAIEALIAAGVVLSAS
jgi:crotonobetainyl-CoA:carnitine CoA-transferase CaiB-like acyl-CoA transferase